MKKQHQRNREVPHRIERWEVLAYPQLDNSLCMW